MRRTITKPKQTRCGHTGCNRVAVRIVSYEKPDHSEFKGQTHDCCSVHSHKSTDEVSLNGPGVMPKRIGREGI